MRHKASSAGSLLLVVFVIAACGGGGPAATTGSQRTTAPATPGSASSADGLCDVFTTALAEAALGAAVSEPSGGDVVPRPAGIYCHYALADDANVNVEAQLKDMPRTEFDALAETLDLSEPLTGVGEAAFQRDSSIMGLPGVTILAWNGTSGVTVTINRDGDSTEMLDAAKAIAVSALAR